MIEVRELWLKVVPWATQNYKDILTTASVAVVILAIAHLSVIWISRRMQKKLVNQESIWMESMFYGLRAPVAVLIWLGGLIYSLLVITESPFAHQASHFCALLIVVCLIWFVLRMVNFAERKYSDPTYSRSRHQRDTVRTVARLGKVITIIIGIIIILQTLGFSVSGLVAFSGVGAAGIAFAAKDTLGNFFGGLMIFLNRPFTVGDWIRSPDRQIEGTVEEIGWFTTRIRTFEKWPIYVPNGMFSTILIENPQRMTNRRIKQMLGVRYDDANNISKITAEIKAMLQAHPEIDQKQTLFVDLVNFGSSSLDIMIYAFTKTTDWVKFQDIQQEILLKVIDIVDQFEAQCAFPTTTLHIDNDKALLHVKKEI